MWIFICIAIVIFFVGLIIYLKKRQKSQSQAKFDDKVYKAMPIEVPRTFDHHYNTPMGAFVSSFNPIPDSVKDAVFAAIDKGITALFVATEHFDYNEKQHHSDFAIAFIPKMATNMDGSPALVTKSGIQTAGTVIGVGGIPVSPSFLLLPENFDPAFMDYLATSVRNEGEHDLAWANDKDFFYAHIGANDVHPLYGGNDTVHGFAALESSAKCPFTGTEAPKLQEFPAEAFNCSDFIEEYHRNIKLID